MKNSSHIITQLHTLIFLAFFFVFGSNLFAQIKVTTGGVVNLSSPNNNTSNYVLVGTNTRLYDSKLTLDAFDKNGICILAAHNYQYGLAFIQKVTNGSTKCNVVDLNGNHLSFAYGDGKIYATQFITSSDKRLKTNLKEIETPMDKVKKLTGYTYQFDPNYLRTSVKARGGSNINDTNTYVGLIAQDVFKVLPEAVMFDEDSLMGVNYPCLIALLVNALKEQQLQIDSLKEANYKVLGYVKGIKTANKVAADSFIQMESPTQTIQPGLVLYQNQPNPFQKETTIKIYSADGISNGQLLITNLNGELITSYKVNGKGDFQIVVEAASLKPGIYLYTLVVDNQEVASRKMLLTQ